MFEKQSYAVKNNKVPGVIKYAFSDLAHVHRLSKDLECLIRTLQVCHVLPLGRPVLIISANSQRAGHLR